MAPIIAVVAAGAMGSAVARRLTEHGAQVPTLLDGRTPASIARAHAAGMTGATEADLAGADLILSILPPGEALGFAQRMSPVLATAGRKAVFVDCNAIDVRTMQSVAAALAPSGTSVVDGGIIGLPPKPGTPGPKFYLSGPGAAAVGAILAPLGLRVGVMDGPVGAASALKMSYAGITKGLTAIAALMVLGATRAGAADALMAELKDSQPTLVPRLAAGLPDMLPKAYRWVAEMREIAGFLDADPAGAAVYGGFATLYERLAQDTATDRTDAAVLEAFAAKLGERSP